MKKLLFAVILLGSGCSSQFTEEVEEITEAKVSYSSEIEGIIDNIYNFCIEWQNIPTAIINDKLETIRYCDLLDKSGDVIPELDGYEDIRHILWPNGYGVKL